MFKILIKKENFTFISHKGNFVPFVVRFVWSDTVFICGDGVVVNNVSIFTVAEVVWDRFASI